MPAMRPEKVERTGALVKVCVPPHVLEVVVPNAREKVRFVERSPPPWSGYVVEIVVAELAGVNPKSEEEATEYSAPEFPAMRPERVERVGRVVKLLVPEKVLEPEKTFESPRRVVLETTMLAVPLKETPLIVLGV